MCTPLGHSLVGYSIYRNQHVLQSRTPWMMFFQVVLISILPDIDFVFGTMVGNPNRYHHLWTHSLAFVLLVGGLYGLGYTLLKRKNGFKAGGVVSGIVLSHIILDFFSRDTREPCGMPLFWPIHNGFYHAPVTIFLDVSKASSNSAFLGSLFSLHNLRTVLMEVVVLSPLLIWMFLKNKRGVK